MALNLGQGLSHAAYQEGERLHKAGLMDMQSTLEENRAMRLAEFKATLESRVADRARTEQVARIDKKAGELVDVEVGKKRGLMDSGIVDRSSWTAEHQAAVDQSLALDRKAMVADPKTRTAAAIATGDIGPKDAAVLTQRDDKELYRMLWEQQKEDGRNARSDARLAAQAEMSDKRLAVMMARIEKSGSSNPTRDALAFLEGSRKEIASEAQTLRALYQSELSNAPKLPEEQKKVQDKYAAQFADIDRRRRLIEADYEVMRERVGLPARSGASPAPAPSPGGAGASRPALDSFQR